MNLHKEEELFEWAVQMTAEKLAIAMNIVERDNFISPILNLNLIDHKKTENV